MIEKLFGSRQELPVIIQSENAECGLACIAMVASYHGNQQDLVSLRRRFEVSGRGSTLNEILLIASDLSLAARPVRVELESLGMLKLPAILHWRMTHFVVLKKATSKYLEIHDPSAGAQKIGLKEASKLFTGIAIEFAPTAKFEKKSEILRTRLVDLFVRFPGFYSAIAQLVVITLLLQLTIIAGSFYLKLVIDDGILRGDLGFITIISIAFGLVVITKVFMEYTRARVQLYFSTQLGFQMANNVHSHLLGLPASFFERRHLGDITSRLSSTGEIVSALTGNLIPVFLDGIFVIVTLVFMFYVSQTLALIVLLITGAVVLLKMAAIPRIKLLEQQKLEASAIANSSIMETIRAVEIIKFYCNELRRLTSWRNFHARSINSSVELNKFLIALDSAKKVLLGFENLLVISLAAFFVVENRLSLGELTAFLALKTNFVDSANSFTDKLVQIRLIKLQLERLSDITKTEKEEENYYIANTRSTEPGTLRVENLYFSYDQGRTNVLSNISMTFAPGEKIVILGKSGAGKSTLLKILAGLLPPTQGAVCLNTQDIWAGGIRKYRSLCGGTLQTDQLFTGTIKDNITLFDEFPDNDLLEEVAQKAKIQDLIESLPMRYHSMIGDMGSIMSAGQGQRILLARAFYKRPLFLFLDEATANLDLETEKDILTALKQMPSTIVIVTHRTSACTIADKVYELSNSQLQLVSAQEKKGAGIHA